MKVIKSFKEMFKSSNINDDMSTLEAKNNQLDNYSDSYVYIEISKKYKLKIPTNWSFHTFLNTVLNYYFYKDDTIQYKPLFFFLERLRKNEFMIADVELNFILNSILHEWFKEPNIKVEIVNSLQVTFSLVYLMSYLCGGGPLAKKYSTLLVAKEIQISNKEMH